MKQNNRGMETKTLALYLGCKMTAFTDGANIDGTFTGLELDAREGQSFVTFYPIGSVTPRHCRDAQVKLHLRPLSSMTEEEAKELFKVFWGDSVEYDGELKINWSSNQKDYLNIEYSRQEPIDNEKDKYDYVSMSLSLMEDFAFLNKWDYVKGNQTRATYQPVYRSNKMTAYLLSKGFDLFGLIEKGEALELAPKDKNQRYDTEI